MTGRALSALLLGVVSEDDAAVHFQDHEIRIDLLAVNGEDHRASDLRALQGILDVAAGVVNVHRSACSSFSGAFAFRLPARSGFRLWFDRFIARRRLLEVYAFSRVRFEPQNE